MPFPIANAVSHVFSFVTDKVCALSSHTYTAAVYTKDVFAIHKRESAYRLVLRSEDKAIEALRSSYRGMEKEQIVEKYKACAFGEQILDVHYRDTALPLQQSYDSHAPRYTKLHNAIMRIQNYLSAVELLSSAQLENLMSLSTFGRTIESIIYAQYSAHIRDWHEILSKEEKSLKKPQLDIRNSVEDIHTLVQNITQHRCKDIGNTLQFEHRVYFRLNEFMQLLFMTHNIINGLSVRQLPKEQAKICAYGVIEDFAKKQDALRQYLGDDANEYQITMYSLQVLRENYLQQERSVLRRYKKTDERLQIEEKLSKVGQRIIQLKALQALQIFMAFAACQELSIIACREFDKLRDDYIMQAVRQTRRHKYYVDDKTFMSYKLFSTRIAQAMHTHYTHRALMHLCQVLQSRVTNGEEISRAIISMLKYQNHIVFALMAQLISFFKASVLIYLSNKYDNVTSSQMHKETHMLQLPAYAGVREEIISYAMSCALSAEEVQSVVLNVLRKMNVPVSNNAQLKGAIVNIFTFDNDVIQAAKLHKAFKEHLHMMLNDFMCNLCYDDLFVTKAHQLAMMMLLAHTKPELSALFEHRLSVNEKYKIDLTLNNIVAVAPLLNKAVSLECTIDDLAKVIGRDGKLQRDMSVMEMAGAIAPFQSHIIYFAIEHMLHESQVFMRTQFQNICKTTAKNAGKAIFAGCAAYGVCHAEQLLNLVYMS